jgi:hypothetical protein
MDTQGVPDEGSGYAEACGETAAVAFDRVKLSCANYAHGENMGRMNLDTRAVNLSFPAPLIEAMKQAAATEHKSLSAFLGDMFKNSQERTNRRARYKAHVKAVRQ